MSAGSTAGETIFALSSAPGRAGVAVLRVSGAQAGRVLLTLTGRDTLPPARQAVLRSFKHPRSGELIDKGLVIWFPGPDSFTGEDCCELHAHGGHAVVRAMIEAIGLLSGCRLAQAGEFARRAFEAGKIDLTAAEGLADLIDAETEQQRRQALHQAGGGLFRQAEQWREELIAVMALVEAAIDFTDEGDIACDAVSQAEDRARTLLADIGTCLDDKHRGEIVRDGFRVAIVGKPNAGKSSLLNALVKRDAAIVSDEPGTTRDLIEVRLDIGGLAIVLTDTAGLREADGTVEKEGIRRSVETAQRSDLAIWLDEPGQSFEPWPEELHGLDLPEDSVLRVASKRDLIPAEDVVALGEDELSVSAKTGDGLKQLTDRISAIAKARVGDDEPAIITQVRHRQHLLSCHRHLTGFLGPDIDIELRAEDLRRAATELGRITGRVDVEDVLDQVFGRFCIGK